MDLGTELGTDSGAGKSAGKSAGNGSPLRRSLRVAAGSAIVVLVILSLVRRV